MEKRVQRRDRIRRRRWRGRAAGIEDEVPVARREQCLHVLERHGLEREQREHASKLLVGRGRRGDGFGGPDEQHVQPGLQEHRIPQRAEDVRRVGHALVAEILQIVQVQHHAPPVGEGKVEQLANDPWPVEDETGRRRDRRGGLGETATEAGHGETPPAAGEPEGPHVLLRPLHRRLLGGVGTGGEHRFVDALQNPAEHPLDAVVGVERDPALGGPVVVGDRRGLHRLHQRGFPDARRPADRLARGTRSANPREQPFRLGIPPDEQA